MNAKVKGFSVYCFDPKYKTYMKMGLKKGDIFYKAVRDVNFMRVVNGYGIQYDAFNDFPALGIKRIKVLEEGGNIWLSKVSDWKNFGKVADYGRGKQIFLSLKYMSLQKGDQSDENNQINMTGVMANMPDKYREKIKGILKKK